MSVERKQEKKNPPLLYNLAELQNDCSKLFKISPDETLRVVQELYEKKMVTYPRTDARVLSSAVAKEIGKNLNGLQGYPMTASFLPYISQNQTYKGLEKTRYVNDKQITDHYAIIPTGQGLSALSRLGELQTKMYEVIVRRFLSIFYPPAVYQKLNVTVKAGEERFFTSTKVLLEEGFLPVTQYSFTKKKNPEEILSAEEKEEEKEESFDLKEVLNLLKKGTSVSLTECSVKEGETSPPKRYNSGSIILAMENAGQLIEDEELREQIKGSGIGTSATRAEILKKLVFIKYLALNKKTQVITPTQLGEMIYDVVHQSIRPLLNPELTASWEKGLTYVAEGSITSEEYMGKLENFVTRHTVNVKQMRNQFQLKSSFDASAPYYKKASSTRSRTGKRTAAEDSSAKSYSPARKKGAQNS